MDRNVPYSFAIGDGRIIDGLRDKVERVCGMAKVTEFLDELPRGYNTKFSDYGVRLCVGQRQRMVIAETLLKDADVMILDEVTTDLDSHLEEHVHSRLETMDGNDR